jgi:hypothetical protein
MLSATGVHIETIKQSDGRLQPRDTKKYFHPALAAVTLKLKKCHYSILTGTIKLQISDKIIQKICKI